MLLKYMFRPCTYKNGLQLNGFTENVVIWISNFEYYYLYSNSPVGYSSCNIKNTYSICRKKELYKTAVIDYIYNRISCMSYYNAISQVNKMNCVCLCKVCPTCGVIFTQETYAKLLATISSYKLTEIYRFSDKMCAELESVVFVVFIYCLAPGLLTNVFV